VKQKRLLDSYALLAYLNKEADYEKVLEVMEKTEANNEFLLMCEINIGEVYYIISRKRGRAKADYFLDTILPSLPIRLIAVNFDLILAAARLKGEYPLSYANCFAAAVAESEGAILMTGDPEFKAIENVVNIDWMRHAG
jgi:uncharacterized protein